MSRMAALVALVAVFVLGPPQGLRPALACTCGDQTEREQFAAATVVFLGTASSSAPGADYTWTFAVKEVLKGQAGRNVSVLVAESDVTDCRFGLRIGQLYRVHASTSKDRLRTDPCSGTRLIEGKVAEGAAPSASLAGPSPAPPPGTAASPNGTRQPGQGTPSPAAAGPSARGGNGRAPALLAALAALALAAGFAYGAIRLRQRRH